MAGGKRLQLAGLTGEGEKLGEGYGEQPFPDNVHSQGFVRELQQAPGVRHFAFDDELPDQAKAR